MSTDIRGHEALYHHQRSYPLLLVHLDLSVLHTFVPFIFLTPEIEHLSSNFSNSYGS